MNKPSKCKNCQWYGKPYWSIINPCDNCPMENVETFTVWQDPTIEELKKENERLNNVINELEKYIIENEKINNGAIKCSLSSNSEIKEMEIENTIYDNILDKLYALKEGK